MNSKTLNLVFKIVIISIGLCYFTGCNQAPYSEKLTAMNADINDSYNAVAENQFNEAKVSQLPKNLKIIKSANVKYKVRNVKNATQKIKNYALQYDAYISDLRFENSHFSLENRFTIKVPQKYFDTMMDSVVKVAEFVDYENITSDDITEKYIDIQSRLKTKIEIKERYESVLRKNAKTVEDILATEEKLRIIQEEIEASQGKLKYLTNKVAYSTIQIDLYEKVNYKEGPETYVKSFGSKSKEALIFGWELIEAIILGLIYIWPLLTIGLLVLLVFKRNSKVKDKN